MSKLFSEEWMKQLSQGWNDDPKIVVPLSNIDFNSHVAYGFIDEEAPMGLLVIEKGKIIRAGAYRNEHLNWDLRASKENWKIWINEGFGLARLGPAVATGKLKFIQGDYRQMIRNLSMSRPFLRHFTIMGELDTEY